MASKKRYRLAGAADPARPYLDAQLLLPTLQAAVEAGGSIRTRDLYAAVAERAGIEVDAKDRAAFENRARWGQQILKIEGMIVPPARRGEGWAVTERGRRFAADGKIALVVPFYVCEDGFALCGDVVQALTCIEDGSTNAIWTSPPFPTRKDVRRYGTMGSARWREWMLRVIDAAVPKLAPDGSMFIHLGQTWNERQPTVDTYIERFAVALEDVLDLHILQRLFRINECALPGPIEWACNTRERLKTSVEIIYWVAPTPHPKASTDRILLPYSAASARSFDKAEHEAAVRHSGMEFSRTSFRNRRGGAIPPTHIVASGSSEHAGYRRACREIGVRPHPCPAQRPIVENPLKVVTSPGDLVGDIFAGSGFVGQVARELGCRHWGIDRDPAFLEGASTRFPDARRVYPQSRAEVVAAG